MISLLFQLFVSINIWALKKENGVISGHKCLNGILYEFFLRFNLVGCLDSHLHLVITQF